jgi:hypothetical protein
LLREKTIRALLGEMEEDAAQAGLSEAAEG